MRITIVTLWAMSVGSGKALQLKYDPSKASSPRLRAAAAAAVAFWESAGSLKRALQLPWSAPVPAHWSCSDGIQPHPTYDDAWMQHCTERSACSHTDTQRAPIQ